MAAGFLPPGAADRGDQRIVGIRVAADQIEFEFRGEHRLPAALLVEGEHAAQHLTRRHRHRVAIFVVAVVDDLRGRFARPRHEADGGSIRLQGDVDDGGVGQAVFLVGRIFAGDGLNEDRFRHAQRAALEEFLRGRDFTTRDAGDVGHQAFDFRHMMFAKPFVQIDHDLLLSLLHSVIPPNGPAREGRRADGRRTTAAAGVGDARRNLLRQP